MATTEVSAASPTETDTGWARVDEFLIARGGPFYALQHRLGLLHGRALNAGRRAAILVGLAWGMPLLLSALFGHAIGPAASRPFLLDLGALRALRRRDRHLRADGAPGRGAASAHLRQFVRAPLLAPGAMQAAAEAVVRALRRRHPATGPRAGQDRKRSCCCYEPDRRASNETPDRR
jgi:hypothetical protein